MHKLIKSTFFIICLLALSFLAFHPAFATDTESSHITETVFFGNLKDDGSACGVFTVLHTVVDIFSVGVGILAVIGITIVGTKYLTAGGNEEQTRKAKHRMLQIIIGIVVYAVLYLGVQWLVPGGKLDFGERCTTISDEELAQIKAKERAEREEQRRRNEEEAAEIIAQYNNSKPSDSDSSSQAIGEPSERGKRILATAKEVAKKISGFSYSRDNANFEDKGDVYRTHSVNCASYASLVMAEAGLLSMKEGRVASDN